MNPALDVVIATYNRHKKVTFLVKQLLASPAAQQIGNIIVVDSSTPPLAPDAFSLSEQVVILHSSHKNQPYQRLLGVSRAKAEFVLFLDDDMEVLDNNFALELVNFIRTRPNLSGINLKFSNVNEFLNQLTPSVLGKSRIINLVRTITGYPPLADNEFWLAGIRGRRVDNLPIQYVSGGAFIGKRELLFEGVSAMLFEIFEHKMGMGEDAIIGFSLSRQGEVVAWPKTYFLHNDQQDSTYTGTGMERFYEKISYSRLFLSMEYARLKGTSKALALMHYIWFALWRLIGLLINFLARPKEIQRSKLQGHFRGFRKAVSQLWKVYRGGNEDRTLAGWKSDVLKDLRASLPMIQDK